MYNRYLNEAHGCEPEPPAEVPASGLLDGLSQRLSSFRLDSDTLILLAIVWFILREDGQEMDSELLVALAVLLLLGL